MRLDNLGDLGGSDSWLWASLAAEDLEFVLPGVNLASRAAFGSIGLGAVKLLKIEEQRGDATDVIPVGPVVRLQDDETPRC